MTAQRPKGRHRSLVRGVRGLETWGEDRRSERPSPCASRLRGDRRVECERRCKLIAVKLRCTILKAAAEDTSRLLERCPIESDAKVIPGSMSVNVRSAHLHMALRTRELKVYTVCSNRSPLSNTQAASRSMGMYRPSRTCRSRATSESRTDHA